MKFLAGFLVAIFVLVGGGLAVIYSGAYNVAATQPHSRLEHWILSTAMHRSIEAQGSAIKTPAPLSDEQARKGFGDFSEMCAPCHGAPGKERSEIGKGLRPHPPDLTEVAKHWDDGHLFWIVKNGIKMTGMPAFGPTHDDERLWNIVAFVRRLSKTTPEQYRRLEQETQRARPSGEHRH